MHMLRAFPTTLKEDRQMLNSDDEKLSDDDRTAVSYRVYKKRSFARTRRAAATTGSTAEGGKRGGVIIV